MYACEKEHFLSVSVSTPKHGGVPQCQLKLTDPHSREQGVGVSGKQIPDSRYEDIVLAPKAPDRSREHAVEVCGAEPGEYLLTVYEHGDELYSLSVGVDARDFLLENFHSREGRIRRYRFAFTVRKDEVDLTWLDENGQRRLQIAANDW